MEQLNSNKIFSQAIDVAIVKIVDKEIKKQRSKMDLERREFIQSIRDFNRGFKDECAERRFGKSYGQLTRQEQLTIDDIIKENNT